MCERIGTPSAAWNPLESLFMFCIGIVEKMQDTSSLPTLFQHFTVVGNCYWMQWYMLTRSLNTSPLHSHNGLLKPLTPLTPYHKQAFYHQPTGYELFTGNPE